MSAVHHPVSPGQRRLWLSTELRPGDPFYNVPFAITLTGRLDHAALHRALADEYRRHPALRLGFRPVAGELTAVAAVTEVPPPAVVAAIGATAAERAAWADELAGRFAAEPFDLADGPLVRTCLVRLDPTEHRLLVAVHHIVFDGPSLGIFVAELTALYAAHATAAPVPLNPPVDYDALVRHDAAVVAEQAGDALRYWTAVLSGAAEVMELPLHGGRSAHTRYPAARRDLRLPPELAARLRQVAAHHRTSLFVVLQTAFAVLLHQHGAADVVVGFALSGRDGTDGSAAIGYFAKPVVQRLTFTGDPWFTDLLTRVHGDLLDTYDHTDLAFEKVLGELGLVRDPGYSPLYQATFGLNERPAAVEAAGVRFAVDFVPLPTCKAELELTVTHSADGLDTELGYRADLFDRPTIDAMIERYRLLLERVADDAPIRIAELVRPSDAEHRLAVQDWNRTEIEYPHDKLIHQLVEEQARRTPDAIAVLAGEHRWTYRELDAEADRIAGRLAALGVRPETAVAVLLPRSRELIAAMVGIFKAGGVYVPLDAALPRQRLRDLVEDVRPAVLLTEDEQVAAMFAGLVPRIVAPTTTGPTARPTASVVSSHAAYILYTSGSTGRPKGVVLEHRNLINLITWAYRECGTDLFRVVPLISSVAFDVAMWEVFTALGCGGSVVVAEDAISLGRTPGAADATVVTAVPSVLTELLKAGGLPPKAHTVFSNGEVLPPTLLADLYRLPSVHTVYNMCAPTETTTFSLFNVVRPGQVIPLGRPMANTTAYVLDTRMRPVPPGVVGQLYLGGAGVSRGYLNQPELTAQRFVPDPFARTPGQRLYATGDLARQLPDGRIVFVGRADHQVKLRGCRIELGEIEATLLAHQDVTEACATVLPATGGGVLAAAVAVRDGAAATTRQIAAFLRERLPGYLVPTRIQVWDDLPLLPSGKLDRSAITRALGRQHDDAGPIDGVPDAPAGSAARAVALLWQAVLGHPAGLDQNFFDAGGNSLLLLSLRERLQERFGREIRLPDLVRRPTVLAIAALVTADAAPRPERVAAGVSARRTAQIARARKKSHDDSR